LPLAETSSEGGLVAARVIVRGRVQGVYFRSSVKQQADIRGVRGWVRNNADGSVEALLQGPREAVSEVAAWMRAGPRGSRVDSTDVEWLNEDEPFAGFDIVG